MIRVARRTARALTAIASVLTLAVFGAGWHYLDTQHQQQVETP